MKILEDNVTQSRQVFAIEDTERDPKDFRDNFNLLPFNFHHHLSADPRFEMDSVRALARRLPNTTSFSGDTTVVKGWERPSSSVEDAMNNLENGSSWIILKKVHEDAQYGSLLSQCLSEVEGLTHRRLEREIESRTMSLIISSAGQVTPYHIDADCNFLFQIRGSKMFYVFDGRDRSVLTEVEEENFWAGDINAAKYNENNQRKAWSFELKPGVGVHVPVIFPHWVKNERAVSMSLSINFRFHGLKYADVFRANHFMRKFGLHPRPVGKSKMADSIKGSVFGGARKVARKLRGL
jgi:hypothetical protein